MVVIFAIFTNSSKQFYSDANRSVHIYIVMYKKGIKGLTFLMLPLPFFSNTQHSRKVRSIPQSQLQAKSIVVWKIHFLPLSNELFRHAIARPSSRSFLCLAIQTIVHLETEFWLGMMRETIIWLQIFFLSVYAGKCKEYSIVQKPVCCCEAHLTIV